jgi:hypothetical protein
MKSLKLLLLEVYWVCLFSLITYLSIKFIGWYHSFNTIIFYSIALWLTYYDYKTFFSNITLFKPTNELFLKNKPISLGLIWFIIRTIFVAIGMFYFLSNAYTEKSNFYDDYKIIGLISFLGFLFVNYIRISIMNIKDIGR